MSGEAGAESVGTGTGTGTGMGAGSGSGSSAGAGQSNGQAGQGGSGSGSQAAGTPDFRSSIPEAYREKTYLRDVKSADDVFKMLDNAQTLIGKQGKGIPAADAPKEAWDSFFKELGRPDSPDKYEFERAEGTAADPEADKAIKAMMHAVGLTGKQAKELTKNYEAFFSQAMQKAQEAADVEFNQFTAEVFGDKADEALRHSQALLDKLTPQAAKKYLPQLGNKALVVLAAVMQEVNRKYVGEDPTRLNNAGGAGGGGADNIDTLRAERVKLMASPEFKDSFHKGHSEAVAKVNAIGERIARINK